MHLLRHLSAALILLASLIATPTSIRAAESYDNCTGFIESLPATITTQGTWCLRQDLSTAMISGEAITIATNNVTIDCNDFKLGGLAAGLSTQTYGIYAFDRLNATIRHCNIRGFLIGVLFQGSNSGGHVVEDNRFDGNTYVGLNIWGDGSVVRRNLLRDTGGSTTSTEAAYGIIAADAVDVLDNTVSGVLPLGDSFGDGTAYGIRTSNNPNGSISSNRVRGVVRIGTGTAHGIYNHNSGRISLRSNDVSGDGSTSSTGLTCIDVDGQDNNGRAKGNIINGFETGIQSCRDDGNSLDL